MILLYTDTTTIYFYYRKQELFIPVVVTFGEDIFTFLKSFGYRMYESLDEMDLYVTRNNSVQEMFKGIAEKYEITFRGSYQRNKEVLLGYIGVPDKEKGTGTKAMNDFCKYLDENKMICTLSTAKNELERLIKFYSRFGFVRQGETNKMIRNLNTTKNN